MKNTEQNSQKGEGILQDLEYQVKLNSNGPTDQSLTLPITSPSTLSEDVPSASSSSAVEPKEPVMKKKNAKIEKSSDVKKSIDYNNWWVIL